MTKNRLYKRPVSGFTLLEMMLVLLIIGLLAALAVINFGGQGKQARIDTTKAQLKNVQTAIMDYYLKNGSYPAALTALVPTQLTRVPKDAWKEEFMYSPASNDPAHPYLLYSKGEDKQAGTQDDLSIWTIDD